jgi:Fe-S cluster assembly protein SufD
VWSRTPVVAHLCPRVGSAAPSCVSFWRLRTLQQRRLAAFANSFGGGYRHDLNIQQKGLATCTKMCHFLLCCDHQLHDLHTSLTLDHPKGTADQLHKCIVSHSTGRGVFDGNVRVNKLAQHTDAGQLSRNLLLVPKATVNVKPNLQIVADDVKCTHGCAVSDLSADEMFYFMSRGIDAATARRALVVSFGAEVVQMLDHKELVERLQSSIRGRLSDSVA